MSEFDELARKDRRGGVVSEFWQFLKHSKKWWLAPLLIVLLVFAVLVALSSTAAAPFIYTLF